MRMSRMNRNAFTLIELLLVLVILAVLAAIVVPKFTNRSQQARETAAKSSISAIKTSLDAFEVDNGRYPTTDEGMGALLAPPNGSSDWKGPYMEKLPKDPWQREFVYKYPGTHNPSGYDIFSLGADGNESPDDIGNWDK